MSALAGAARWMKKEVLEILPVTVFFLVGLNLIAFTKQLVLLEEGIAYEGVWAATIGALLVAKVVLVVDKTPFMQLYRGRPLYRPVLYRAIVYTAAVLIVRLGEVLAREAISTGGLASALAAARTEVVWPQFVFVQVWVFVMFLIYVTVVEVLRAVGEDGLARLLFTRDNA